MDDRKSQHRLIPEDISKKDLGELLLKYFRLHGQDAALKALIVVDEPHRKFMPGGEMRARHKHVIVHMTSPFAHKKVQDWLAGKSVKGFFSFNLTFGMIGNTFRLCIGPQCLAVWTLPRKGFAAYCTYLFEASHKKLVSDIDQDPWIWPSSLTKQKVISMMKAMPKDQQAKNGLTTQSTRKRKMLTFSEVTDIIVEEQVRSEPQLWAVAKKKKMEGDDTLWNYLGEQRCIVSLLSKINKAWHPTETGRTLKGAPKYSLMHFRVPSAVQEWVSTTHKSKALILSGRGEIGKTSLAAAALASICGHYHFISSRDQIKGLIFLNSEGLLWDEACFAELDVDLCKGLVDLEHDRSIRCRHVDGMIPAGTPRVYATNHSWESFWPRLDQEHRHAIQRRVEWVTVAEDLRLQGPEEPLDDEDVFGHGGQLD